MSTLSESNITINNCPFTIIPENMMPQLKEWVSEQIAKNTGLVFYRNEFIDIKNPPDQLQNQAIHYVIDDTEQKKEEEREKREKEFNEAWEIFIKGRHCSLTIWPAQLKLLQDSGLL